MAFDPFEDITEEENDPFADIPADVDEYTIGEALGGIGRTVLDLPTHVKGSIARGIEGTDPYSNVNTLDEWREESNRRHKEDIERERAKASPGETAFGLTPEDAAGYSKNLAYSVTAAGAGLLGAAVGSFGGKAGAWAGGGIGTGVAAQRMAANEFITNAVGSLDAAGKEGGIQLTDEQKVAAAKELEEMANKAGWWEAVPEVAGNLLGLKVIASPLKGVFARAFGDKLAARAIKKLGIVYGIELGTETITQTGQHNVDIEAGLSDEPTRSFASASDLGASLKEIAAPTILTTTTMAGGTALGVKAFNAYKNRGGIDPFEDIGEEQPSPSRSPGLLEQQGFPSSDAGLATVERIIQSQTIDEMIQAATDSLSIPIGDGLLQQQPVNLPTSPLVQGVGAETAISADIRDLVLAQEDQALDAGEQNKRKRVYDPRLEDTLYSDGIRKMAAEVLPFGGTEIVPAPGARKTSDTGDVSYDYDKTIRTPSLNPSWFKNQGWTRKQVNTAVDRATKGSLMSKKQRQIVDSMLDEIEGQELENQLYLYEGYQREESVYDPEWDAGTRALSDLAEAAIGRGVPESKVGELMQSSSPDPQIAQELANLIGERDGQKSQGSLEETAAETSAETVLDGPARPASTETTAGSQLPSVDNAASVVDVLPNRNALPAGQGGITAAEEPVVSSAEAVPPGGRRGDSELELTAQTEEGLTQKEARAQDKAIAAKEQADREVGQFDLQQQVDDTPPAPPGDMFEVQQEEQAPESFDVTHAATQAQRSEQNKPVLDAWNAAHLSTDSEGKTHRKRPDHFDEWYSSGGVTPEVGSQYDAHGIAKSNPLGALLNLLENGINKSRRFDTAPLVSNTGAGGALGASGAYKDGPFIIAGDRGKMLTDGISNVLVSDAVAEVIPSLKARFPDVTFIKYSEAQGSLQKAAIGKKPKEIKRSTTIDEKFTPTHTITEDGTKVAWNAEAKAWVDETGQNEFEDTYDVEPIAKKPEEVAKPAEKVPAKTEAEKLPEHTVQWLASGRKIKVDQKPFNKKHGLIEGDEALLGLFTGDGLLTKNWPNKKADRIFKLNMAGYLERKYKDKGASELMEEGFPPEEADRQILSKKGEAFLEDLDQAKKKIEAHYDAKSESQDDLSITGESQREISKQKKPDTTKSAVKGQASPSIETPIEKPTKPKEPSEEQGKAEKKAAGKAAAEKAGPDLATLPIKYQAEVNGKIETVRENAQVALDARKDRVDALVRMRKCLG